MERRLAYTLMLLVFCAFVRAQDTSPYWSLAGNSNATSSSHKLGTTNAYPLRLTTNNSTRIYIGASNGYVGIGTTAPSSRLHVNAASGTSPLKVAINSSTKLYMSSGGGLSVGSGSTPPSNGLYVAGNVGIGTSYPSYKLHVEGGSATAIYGNSSTGTGIYGYSESGYGLYGSNGTGSYGIAAYGNTGVYGTGYYGVQGVGTFGVYGNGGNYGVYGKSDYTGVYGDGYLGVYGSGVYGIYGSGLYGVYGYTGGGINGSPSGVYAYNDSYGYGVQAYCRNGSGIYASGGTYAGYFTGPVYATTYYGSDRKLKQNITDVTSALGLINKLQPKSYEYRQDGNYKLMHLPEGTHYGLIAQDLEQVLPNLVKNTTFDPNIELNVGIKEDPKNRSAEKQATAPAEVIDFKAVNYTELIPIMIKGMQEQEAAIKAKDEHIAALEERLNKLEALITGTNAITRNTLGYLEQNTPNPVSGATTIRYHIPETATAARLDITTAKGELVKTISLNRSGSGQVTLNTGMLASGTYNYTLYVDDKVADRKRLLVAK